jgi:iron only hydrogenase large subunit-like protein
MSAILSADTLNDFISPGVACIKPVETLPAQETSHPYEVTTEDKVQASNPAPAGISLTDCLACSGCVTSAEAVLISLQSHAEVLNTLDTYPALDVRIPPSARHKFTNGTQHPTDAKLFVASVSPQVRASLAATYGVSEKQAGHMIEQFLSGTQGLKSGGRHGSSFAYVVDTNRMREACLVLGAEEVTRSFQDNSQSRPLLTSACPGWICYAEKTHPHVLPHLSKLKSPQALTGTMLKSVLSKKYNTHPSQIWHLALMPCFDKKLEASREELTDRWWRHDAPVDSKHEPVRDVDCVITTRELLTLANARGINLSRLPLKPLPKQERTPFPDSTLSRYLFPRPRRRQEHGLQVDEAGTSGGYLHHVLKTQQSLRPGSTIVSQRGRNADIVEFTLMSEAGAPILKCARFYGFRNIQNLVRKLKPARTSKLPGAARRNMNRNGGSGASEYAYVEVMACPGGCTNGGGQVRVEDVAELLPETRGEVVEKVGVQSQKEWLRRVDEAYFSADSEDETMESDEDEEDAEMHDADCTGDDPDRIDGIATKEVGKMLNHWAVLTDVALDKLVFTSFREVESDVGKEKGKTMSDTERIAAVVGMSGGGW